MTDESSDSGAGGNRPADAPPRPTAFLRIINPDATSEEIAAIVAVFASLGVSPAPAPRPRPEWSAHHRKLRAPVRPGPGGWRSSSLPH